MKSLDLPTIQKFQEGRQKELIVYHTNWSTYDRNYQVFDLPTEWISTINYAFFNLQKNECGYFVPVLSDKWADIEKPLPPPCPSSAPYQGNLGQFYYLLNEKGQNFRLGMSIGGWTFSKYFSTAVATKECRLAFIDGIMQILNQFSIFKNVDLDWEHISPNGEVYGHPENVVSEEDGPNFGIFLKELRLALNLNGFSHVTITACATGATSMMSGLPFKSMAIYLDGINIMTYDFASSSYGPVKAGHHTNLFSTPYAPQSVHAAVQAYISKGTLEIHVLNE